VCTYSRSTSRGWRDLSRPGLADPRLAGGVLKEAFEQPGPTSVEAVVDPNESPLPEKLTTDQTWQFVKPLALVKGDPDRWDIIRTVENKIRETV
jgi:pyruvate dehydrogenase (quinone)